MKLFIGNAFSLSMLDRENQYSPRAISLGEAMAFLQEWKGKGLGIESCIGHADTASILSNELGMELPMNRVSVKLSMLDHLLVGQYVGPRLPEGTTQLPEGAAIEWWII